MLWFLPTPKLSWLARCGTVRLAIRSKSKKKEPMVQLISNRTLLSEQMYSDSKSTQSGHIMIEIY